MDFAEQLAAIEDLADTDGPEAAIERLEGLASGRPLDESARVQLLLAQLTARTGDFDAASSVLERARVLAKAAGRASIILEERVTRASVLAASGSYDEAIPMMADAIDALAAHPELAELLADARAELRSYRNLVSPKTRATWASLLQ